MKKEKRRRLERAGWSVGSASDFLGLSADESALVELKLALATNLKKRRRDRGMTQTELAKRLGSSQPRVARMESADRSVTLDLLVRSLLALGATRRDLARILDVPKGKRAA
jgi:DNA-binding XRE family transcriptional regulator